MTKNQGIIAAILLLLAVAAGVVGINLAGKPGPKPCPTCTAKTPTVPAPVPSGVPSAVPSAVLTIPGPLSTVTAKPCSSLCVTPSPAKPTATKASHPTLTPGPCITCNPTATARPKASPTLTPTKAVPTPQPSAPAPVPSAVGTLAPVLPVTGGQGLGVNIWASFETVYTNNSPRAALK